MNTVFIGGSRRISRLPAEIRKRLANIVASKHNVIVGDANGADKAVQKYLHDAAYDQVTIFCSGEPRNNAALWPTRRIVAPQHTKGFQFYAAKDRVMAREADFGLMIWDGRSAGTILNVLRLMRAGKIVVLFDVPGKRAINIKELADWERFMGECSREIIDAVRNRATPDEWQPGQQTSVVNRPTDLGLAEPASAKPTEVMFASSLNAAFAAADPAAVVDVLGSMARVRGMTQLAKETGLARESLYRALGAGGNPEFATVLKVLSSFGLRLTAGRSSSIDQAAQ